ncbi:MAG: TauD/TfdA family dioxygenase [Actinomycetota bacterium]|nr:TauD/TfdA family dioxygenase [Actinomycetota bacterium]
MTGACSALRESGFVWIRSALVAPAAAFAKSWELIEECTASSGHDAPSVIGDFILPPRGGEATRDFQTLHFDFGVPLRPVRDQDVARYTALFIPRSAVGVTAVTRLVPLDALLGQRGWPDRATLLDNLMAYGESHGAWDDADGYSEGSLGRVVEAAAGAPRLPSVKSTPGFLCGTEFDNLAAELSFFKRLGLDVDAVQVEIPLQPGDLLVFDNLALAHGRRGSRRPGELHQRVYGHQSLSPTAQRALRDRFLAVFREASTGSAAVSSLHAVGGDEVPLLTVEPGMQHPT